MNIAKRIHNLNQTSFMDLSGLGGDNRKQSSDNLQLNCLFINTLANFINNCINKLPGEGTITFG